MVAALLRDDTDHLWVQSCSEAGRGGYGENTCYDINAPPNHQVVFVLSVVDTHGLSLVRQTTPRVSPNAQTKSPTRNSAHTSTRYAPLSKRFSGVGADSTEHSQFRPRSLPDICYASTSLSSDDAQTHGHTDYTYLFIGQSLRTHLMTAATVFRPRPARGDAVTPIAGKSRGDWR
ncbi:hypothetical protein P167DRAFT_543408 [Morchella conica CCBAS932]|uniref:Uncharacterized protein n=1 Tax=Morchella conica CCBAS932 TaxID=1392247 RepID=A0A3N4LAR0_9PEZI|nr:hypothetical protein P167DRAFT_543408 [Morchella conica CCBAS932]